MTHFKMLYNRKVKYNPHKKGKKPVSHVMVTAYYLERECGAFKK